MKGKAIIFSAPSGAGKTTIVKHLLEKIPSLQFSVSATTRKRRTGEVDEKDYYFLSTDAFESKVSQGEILEWQEVYPGAYYGTLKSEVERIWSSGGHVIFDVEVLGGMNLKKAFQERALAIFVKVENLEVLRNRLQHRETESPESLEERINRAQMEMSEESKFDVVVVNQDLADALKKAEDLVRNFIEL